MVAPAAVTATALTAHQLHFDGVVTSPVRLHPHKGSALRGMLFHALRGDAGSPAGFCVNRREPECHRCPYYAMCPISALLATVDPASPRGLNVPRPYTIEPPLGTETLLPPGAPFRFGLTLFASALTLFPYVIVGVRELERRGIGLPMPGPDGRPRRGHFRLRRIVARNPVTGSEQTILQEGDDLVQTPDLPITHDQLAAAPGGGDAVTLEFLTPLRLVDEGRLVHRPQFRVLVHRLFERLEALAAHYAGEPLRFDRPALLALADCVDVVEDRTRWLELASYSTRRGASSPISGFVGRATFRGPLGPFWPWLRWAEIVHVGKDAVKGNGWLRVVEAGEGAG
jgi:hypothetical protein